MVHGPRRGRADPASTPAAISTETAETNEVTTVP
jgi:hypothetical protein